jgi:hypothetical protein
MKEEMLEKAKERGYDLWMQNSSGDWYSFVNDRWHINLELYTETGEFVLNHMSGIIKITTDKCGSFMNDNHFNRIQREMRKIVRSILWGVEDGV